MTGYLDRLVPARMKRAQPGDMAVDRSGMVVLGATAAALAATALVNLYYTYQAEAATPPKGGFVYVNGVRLQYIERGAGRPVVLIHGNGTMAQDWETSGVMPALARSHRVIAFDRPGFGYSDRPRGTIWTPARQAELIASAMRRLDIKQPVVVGHSFGSLVAAALALDHPDAVAGAILVSGYYKPTLRADTFLLSPPAIPVIGDLLRHTISPLLGRLMFPGMARTLFAPSPIPQSFSAFPREMALRPSQIRAAAADTAVMVPGAAKLASRYGELAMPVVILAGDGDQVADFERQSVRLHRSLAGSELRRIEGAGHMVHYTHPEEVVAAVQRVDERVKA